MDAGLSTKQVKCLKWICQVCERECIPIRSESRCLCGHRLNEHGTENNSCTHKNCTCPGFFFIVAQGSWILRCRCKHKHIDHNPISHQCSKTKCDCSVFNSPWICNCNHPWGEHRQVVGEKEVLDMKAMMNGDGIAATTDIGVHEGMADEVNRWDLLNRGLDDK